MTARTTLVLETRCRLGQDEDASSGWGGGADGGKGGGGGGRMGVREGELYGSLVEGRE